MSVAKEVCTISIRISDDYDREFGFELEDVVKNAWSHMTPWFTRRHGVRDGKILLCHDKVEISWKYESDIPPEYEE